MRPTATIRRPHDGVLIGGPLVERHEGGDATIAFAGFREIRGHEVTFDECLEIEARTGAAAKLLNRGGTDALDAWRMAAADEAAAWVAGEAA
jgi:hypothetical protein